MTDTPTCGNCRFSIAATDGEGKINWHQRFCRWGPPIPVVVGMSQTGPVIQCFWPTMLSTANCHRHENRDIAERLPGDAKPEAAEAVKPS